MERFCGLLAASGKSRRSPYVSISHRICDLAQLNQIKVVYDLEESLDLRGPSGKSGDSYDNCGCLFYMIRC